MPRITMRPNGLVPAGGPQTLGLIFFFFLLLASTTGVFGVGFARFYLGDIYIGIFFTLMVYQVITQTRPLVQRWMLIGFGILMLFLIFDLLNRVPRDDLIRGVLRNYIFCFVALATCLALEAYGRRWAAWWIIGSLVSFPLFALLLSFGLVSNIDRLFRWENGVFLLLPIQAFVVWLFRARKLRLLVGAGLFVGMGVYAYTMDIRSLSGMLWCAAFVEILCVYKYIPVMLRVPAFLTATVLFIAAAFIAYTEITGFDYSVYQRRLASDSLRYEMANDAWDSYLSSPVLGNGSWQHARSFVDPDKMEALIGVHSTVIQFAYEYGTLGLIVGCAILLAHVAALGKMVMLHRLYATDWLYGYLLLLGIYHTIMSPFAGPQRFTLGVSLGIACSVLFRSSRHVWGWPEKRSTRLT
jgi:hypothetical protein